jgi:hypothetical protein
VAAMALGPTLPPPGQETAAGGAGQGAPDAEVAEGLLVVALVGGLLVGAVAGWAWLLV